MVTATKTKMIETDLGREKLCTRCGEYWPADNMFFYRGNCEDGLHTWCKACCAESKIERKEAGINKVHLECKRCGYGWYQKKLNIPKTCPRYKSPYWNLERRNNISLGRYEDTM